MAKGRPVKVKKIKQMPMTIEFSPRGRAGRPGCQILRFEEMEAIRLGDHLGLSQIDAAAFMNISQQTFSRLLNIGRRKVAGALVNGKIIRIDGGVYSFEK